MKSYKPWDLLLLLLLFVVQLAQLGFASGATASSSSEKHVVVSMEQDNNNFLEDPFASVPPFDFQKEERHFLSATLGSNMVLQRDRPAMLWGFSSQPGASVSIQVTLGKKSRSTADEKDRATQPRTEDDEEEDELVGLTATTTARETDGLWRWALPAQPATMNPATIQITNGNTGETAKLTNVLFGDVYVCGGQSNMQFAMPATTNATAEAARAADYPHIRLFTVGQGTQSPNAALLDLQTVEQPWTVAAPDSVMDSHKNNDGFSYFSSVCWFFGREVADGLQNQVPIGLVSNNWGGTKVELWMEGGALFNSMIHPYMVGPMSITGFAWYQGESNTKDQAAADTYAQHFPTMITTWRDGFGVPDDDAYFGFVQLSTWCPDNPVGVAELRVAQMAALELPSSSKIGYATNADHGWGCNVHPPPKQYCGKRLGRSALALQYGHQQLHWKSPTYRQVTKVSSSPVVLPRTRMIRNNHNQVQHQVVIEFKDVTAQGLYLLQDPYNSMGGTLDCAQQNQKIPGSCAWASVLFNNQQGWVNATIELVPGTTNQITLTAAATTTIDHDNDNNEDNDDTTITVLATSYGWGSIPMLTIYDAGTDLPVLPWKEKLDSGSSSSAGNHNHHQSSFFVATNDE